MAGASRVASDVLSVLAMAKPFVKSCRRSASDRRQEREVGLVSRGNLGSVPAGQTELLRLLLHVLVVERRSLGGVDLAGAHLDADLLQRRALDRGLELQRGTRVAAVEVGLGVFRHLRDVGRQLAGLGEEGSL